LRSSSFAAFANYSHPLLMMKKYEEEEANLAEIEAI